MPSPRDQDVGFGVSSGRVSKAAVDLVRENWDGCIGGSGRAGSKGTGCEGATTSMLWCRSGDLGQTPRSSSVSHPLLRVIRPRIPHLPAAAYHKHSTTHTEARARAWGF